LRNESTKRLIVENIYRDSEEARHNVQVFSTAATLAEARPLLKKASLGLLTPHPPLTFSPG
jgi:hypothetical protein